MKDKALKLAQEVIEMLGAPSPLHFSKDEIIKWQECNASIATALAQPEQEPVAWVDASSFAMMHQDPRFDRVQWQTTLTLSKVYEGQMPLYTTPPQRKPLTDERVEELIDDLFYFDGTRWSTDTPRAVVRAIREET